MSSISEELFNCLNTVQCPGEFYASGALEIFTPLLEVNSVGRISFPLLPVQAEQLIAIAEQAPYGRGQETLVDTQVRRTWQIDAGQLSLGGKHWQADLDAIVKKCAVGMGVSGQVSAELYKLLVYDEGSFFVSHRDTEKADGMFATLVIVLPSAYSGGELLIKHQQQQVKLDLRSKDAAEISYAAFYADCLHEVLPVTQGYRPCLIYNLIRPDKTLPLPKPPDYSGEQTAAASLLCSWADSFATGYAEDRPEKLIYLLEHAYSMAELGFDALKSADAAIADVLVAAAGQADCDIHLALVSVEESGVAEYAGYGGGYWDDEEDENEAYEAGEVIDSIETIGEWRRLDGQESPLPDLPFSAEEFCPPGAFERIEPADIEFQEATGNAGASFERRYHCAALVIWPRAQYLAILNQAGLAATLPVLADFCRQWEEQGREQGAKTWQDAHTLATYMLRDGLENHPGNNSSRVFLDCLYRLADRECIRDYWLSLAERGYYNQEDGPALLRTAEFLPWADVVALLEKAIGLSAVKAQAACAALLVQCCEAKLGPAQELIVAATRLLVALPGDPKRFAGLQPWEYGRISVDSELVVNVLRSFSVIDAKLADIALDYLLAWPAMYAMDQVLVHAALALTETAASRNLAAVGRLRAEVVAHLQARVSLDLEPPKDWRRDSMIPCKCRDCADLRDFLDSPTQANWAFKAAEGRRKHLEYAIQQQKCDLDTSTERKSRPYSLVCRKNQASYRRRVTQREKDLNRLASLGAG